MSFEPSQASFKQGLFSLSQEDAEKLARAVQAKYANMTVTVGRLEERFDKEAMDFFASVDINPYENPPYGITINVHESGQAYYVQARIKQQVQEVARSEQGLGREIPDGAITVRVAKKADPSRGR